MKRTQITVFFRPQTRYPDLASPRRHPIRRALLLLVLLPASLHAQAPAPAKVPDSIIFTNGEQLTGELDRADAGGVLFKSAMVGTINVKWNNIKELHSSKNFAVLTAKQKLTRKDAFALVPQGQLSVENKTITVTSTSGSKAVPVAEASRIVDAAAFDKAVNHPSRPDQGWAGMATAGASIVRATQNSATFTGSINLVRSSPGVDWLPAHSRTLLGYNQSYGKVTQFGTPFLKSNIFHANAERDQYFSPRVYAFASSTFDHNFSQTLNLQQAYGGGIGITLLKSARQQLDFKGDVHYQKESFVDPTQDVNLFGSTFVESYLRHLPKGLAFNEFGSVSPSWNQTSAYSTHVNASLVFPVYKGFGYNIGAVDDYLNNAPAGSRKNSSQFTTGITYTIKPR